MTMQTEFAPAERASKREVERQYHKLAGLPLVKDFLDAVPNMSVALNAQRQIVFANRAFAEFVGVTSTEEVLGRSQCEVFGCIYGRFLGQRPGEAVGCVRAALTEGGCGTTNFCRTCGAVVSITNSQERRAVDIQECRMLCQGDGETPDALDLRVWSCPIEVEGEAFTLFSLMDISDEKRRKALERIFFHDVLNTAGGVKGLADLLILTEPSETEARDSVSMLSESAEQLIDEINAQRLLSAAESGELIVSVEKQNSLELMSRIIRQFHSLACARGKDLVVDGAAEHFHFSSDPVLVRRVLINLVKNALEAVAPGETVMLNCYPDGDSVCFTVHSAVVMPPTVQLQLFTRSFSTKGDNRGLGTYSIKLISEKYLGGTVSFVSNEEQGTVFTVRYPRVLAGKNQAERT